MRLAGVFLATLLTIPQLQADTVELSGGGHLDGEVQQRGTAVIVALDDEIQVAVPSSRVRRVVKSEQLAKYRQLVIAAGEDAEKHYQLAIWCIKNSNVPGNAQQYKRYHMRRAVDLDPDHTKARAALGFTRDEGKWILTSELMRKRGMITRGGSWELPETLALEDFRDSSDVSSKKWIREVKRLVTVISRSGTSRKNSEKAAEALATLRAIEDPQAAGAIADQLLESGENNAQSREMRSEWIELLGRFKNMTAVQALVQVGVEDSDPDIREKALAKLQEFGASSAVATYLQMLKSNDNQTVNRAAQALSWFPDPELALTYVEALVTTHKQQLAPGPGMSVGFGDNGGGGLSTGGKPKVIVEKRTNPGVLSLLKVIEPDVDFGYDEQAWLNYFARTRSTFSGDLRRDP